VTDRDELDESTESSKAATGCRDEVKLEAGALVVSALGDENERARSGAVQGQHEESEMERNRRESFKRDFKTYFKTVQISQNSQNIFSIVVLSLN
jgi:hypothetical protein